MHTRSVEHIQRACVRLRAHYNRVDWWALKKEYVDVNNEEMFRVAVQNLLTGWLWVGGGR